MGPWVLMSAGQYNRLGLCSNKWFSEVLLVFLCCYYSHGLVSIFNVVAYAEVKIAAPPVYLQLDM